MTHPGDGPLLTHATRVKLSCAIVDGIGAVLIGYAVVRFVATGGHWYLCAALVLGRVWASQVGIPERMR